MLDFFKCQEKNPQLFTEDFLSQANVKTNILGIQLFYLNNIVRLAYSFIIRQYFKLSSIC